jgi:PPK2 family polyphosphate:nucleotide phosphotransferase
MLFSPKELKRIRVEPGARVRLSEYDTGEEQRRAIKREGADVLKQRAAEALTDSREKLRKAQELLYADDRYALLIVLQGLDAAGKDGMIRHVMSGVNPQACQVYSFKKPSVEELDHTFLWRCMTRLPERGRIGIFNRSYYEEVLVVRVHPEILDGEPLPTHKYGRKFWKRRFDDINAFEHHLVRNGTQVLKFYLHLSKREQKRRLLERLDDPRKHWKFSPGDLVERKYWDRYTEVYEDMLTNTSTRWAPWYIIPADFKWTARAMVAEVITREMHALDLHYPELTDATRKALRTARAQLKRE